MSPPAAWKRRLRCGLVGSWALMRSDGVRSAVAGVSTASSFTARMAARIAAGSQRSRRRVLWMQCSGQGVSIAVLRGVHEFWSCSVLVSYTTLARRVAEAAQTQCKQPKRATALAYGQDLQYTSGPQQISALIDE